MKQVVVFLVFFLCYYSFAIHSIDCNVNEKLHYEYKSRIHSFGGTINRTHDNKNSTSGERIEIRAMVYITCTKQWLKKTNNTQALPTRFFLMHMGIENMEISVALDDSSKLPGKANERLDPHFKHLTAFTMSSNGKIHKVFHSKKEDDWVTVMKKTIISQFQVKFKESSRVEKDTIGKHKAHYSSIKLGNGIKMIRKEFTDRDMKKKDIMRKQIRLNSSSSTIIGPNRQIQAIAKRNKIILGKHHLRTHPTFLDNRNVPFDEHSHFGTGANMFMNADETTTLQLIKTEKFSGSIHEFIRNKNGDNEELVDKHPEFDIHEDLVESDLGVKKSIMDKLGKNIRRKSLQTKYSNPSLLIEQLVKKPDDVMLIAILSEFAELDEPILEQLAHKFEQVFKESAEHDFLLAVQAIMAASQSTKAQRMLLQTMKNKQLIYHAMEKSISIQKPIPEFVQRLHHYAQGIHTELDDTLSRNALLSLGTVASRVPQVTAKRIMDTIAETLLLHNNSISMKDFYLYLHIMGNAGDAAPLHVIEKLLNHPRVPEKIKLVAADCLRHRVKRDKQRINRLVHKLVESKKTSIPVKLAMIKAQSEREMILGDGASLSFFKQQMIKPSTPRILKAAMGNYYYAHGTDEVGEELADIERQWATHRPEEEEKSEDGGMEEMSDSEFFVEIVDSFKDMINGVGRTIQKGVDYVRDASFGKLNNLVADAKKVFGSVQLTQNQICVPASRLKDDNICLFDRDMLSYVTHFGGMANHEVAGHFEFERLIGGNKANLYIGALGYAGVNDLCGRSGKIEYVIAGKFMAKANVFGKSFELATGSIHVSLKRDYEDSSFLRILGRTMQTPQLLGQNYCRTITKNLYRAPIANIPALTARILIGPIPLAFSARVTSYLSLDAKGSYCLGALSADAALIPAVSVGVTGFAGIDAIIANAGVEARATFNYELIPSVEVRGSQCQVCNLLDSEVRPMSLEIEAVAELKFVGKKTYPIYNWEAEAERSRWRSRCLTIRRN